MQVKTLQIHWHEKQPIFSCDFDPSCPTRLATAGGDNNIRIWRVSVDEQGESKVEYVASLSRHVKQVNCVRFSPNGQYLASAGDGGMVILWKQSAAGKSSRSAALFGAEFEDDGDEAAEENVLKEHWSAVQHFRASDLEDIYDLAWSPDSRFALFGLSDHSIQIWDVTAGVKVKSVKEHGNFVQGVAWDPLGAFLATQSSDRSVRVWRSTVKINGNIQLASFGRVSRALLSLFDSQYNPAEEEKMHSMFFDETLVTFFRRLAFSPDGSLLFMPTGLVPAKYSEGRGRHAFFISTRGQLSGMPGIVVEGSTRGIIAIRPHPRLFRLELDQGSLLIALPYRIVYATASQDTLCIYDSTRLHPIASFSSLHYGTLTDLAWSIDGQNLIVTATDGFASVISIGAEDLGQMMTLEEQEEIIASLREKYAPGAIPVPVAKHSDPLDLNINLTSDFNATSELDPNTLSTAPPSSPTVINILPVKRKVTPALLCLVAAGACILLYVSDGSVDRSIIPAKKQVRPKLDLEMRTNEIVIDRAYFVDKNDPNHMIQYKYQGNAKLAKPSAQVSSAVTKDLRNNHDIQEILDQHASFEAEVNRQDAEIDMLIARNKRSEKAADASHVQDLQFRQERFENTIDTIKLRIRRQQKQLAKNKNIKL